MITKPRGKVRVVAQGLLQALQTALNKEVDNSKIKEKSTNLQDHRGRKS